MAQLPPREPLCAAPSKIGRDGFSHEQLNLAGPPVLAALKQAMEGTAGPGQMPTVLKLVRQACTQSTGSDAEQVSAMPPPSTVQPVARLQCSQQAACMLQVAAAFLQTCDSQQPPLLPESLIELLREVAGWGGGAPPPLVAGLIERALQRCTEAEATSAQVFRALMELQTHGISIPGDLLRATHLRQFHACLACSAWWFSVPLQRHLLTCRLEKLLESKCNRPWGLLAASLPIFRFNKGLLSMHQLWRLLSLVQKYDSSLQRPEVGLPFLHRPSC